jgi:hypothetical protein
MKCASLCEVRVKIVNCRFIAWPKALNNMKSLSRVYLTANSIVGLEDMAVLVFSPGQGVKTIDCR